MHCASVARYTFVAALRSAAEMESTLRGRFFSGVLPTRMRFERKMLREWSARGAARPVMVEGALWQVNSVGGARDFREFPVFTGFVEIVSRARGQNARFCPGGARF